MTAQRTLVRSAFYWRLAIPTARKNPKKADLDGEDSDGDE
jgi:hypothetical protein